MDFVVTYKDQHATPLLVVVEESGLNLLGQNWLISIQLDSKTLYTLSMP